MILQWLAWNLGLRNSILIGKDAIMGMGQDSVLSHKLVRILNLKNVHLLYQASRVLPQGSISSTWLDSTELGLVGETTTEWER